MLLTKSLKIILNRGNIPYYKKFKEFKNTKIGDKVDINIKYIPKTIKYIVEVKCDICGEKRKIQYSTYWDSTKKETEIYTCRGKCTNIKRKKTNLKLYGIKNCFQDTKKVKKGMMKNHGVNHNMKLQKCLDDRKETYLKNWGVDNPKKNKSIKKKSNNTRFKTFLKKYEDKFNIINSSHNELIIECNNHNFTINKNLFYVRLKSNIEICTICNPINSVKSKYEIELQNFIKYIYKKIIIINKRNIISPLELDIYIPELKLAFEFNGVYWHNELYKDKNYHLNKTELCESKGIQLIHIWEDDWIYKQDIVKSMILNKLGKTPNKIYGRKTIIKEIIDNKIVRTFLEINHLQGFIGSKIKLGLYYENKLVSMMIFGKRRVAMGKKLTNEGEYELLRYCNKLNTNIVGGASKLFKYFIGNFSPKEITTYADRSHSNGNLYETLGFKFISKTQPNYYYIIDGIRHHRFNFRKDKLIKEGFDSNKTEHQIMIDRNIYRIFDSGNLKYISLSMIIKNHDH